MHTMWSIGTATPSITASTSLYLETSCAFDLAEDSLRLSQRSRNTGIIAVSLLQVKTVEAAHFLGVPKVSHIAEGQLDLLKHRRPLPPTSLSGGIYLGKSVL